MVAVPAHAAADVQQDLGQKLKNAGYLVADGFRGMEMASVEAEQLAPRDRVAEVKLVRTDGAAFRADAKEFSFDGVQVVFGREGLLEHGVERGGEAFARGLAVGGRVLEAVGDPDVGDARRAERPAHRRADFARATAVRNPE